ncbi:MAG TPA: substrate-binding domain-containing protein, partial [Chthonomonadaceae bacterium]|nr:substrate-binding domain-containing protein [Chthonomonadaceae bacterium]
DTWFATMTQPKLTSVHMPIDEMGTRAAEMLITLVEGGDVADRQPVLPVSLSVRESCGALPIPPARE